MRSIRRHPFGPTPREPRRPKAVVPECGTETGYQRHRGRGEKCEPCRLAHNEHNRARYAERVGA